MQLQIEKSIQCPWCGEMIDVLIDNSIPAQEYVEDCQVCCSPMLLNIQFIDDQPEIQIRREND